MPGIRDFSGGVKNQVLLNKDTGNGVIVSAKNVVSSYQGELRKRTGTRFLDLCDEDTVLIPYRKADGNDLVLEISESFIKAKEFLSEDTLSGAETATGTPPQFPTSGWTGVTQGDWTVDSSSELSVASWVPAFNVPTQVRPMTYYGKGGQFTYPAHHSNATAYITISNTSDVVFNKTFIRWVLTCSGNHPGHYKGWTEPVIQYSDDGQNWVSIQTIVTGTGPFADTMHSSYYYGSGSNGKTENYTYYSVEVGQQVAPHKHWRILFTKIILNNYTYGSERLELCVKGTEFVSSNRTDLVLNNPWGSDFKKVRWAQNGSDLYIVCEGQQPYKFNYKNYVCQFSAFNASHSLFANDGFPTCVAVYAGRLWFGGFQAFPNRVVGSAFNDLDNFDPNPNPIVATSPIYVDGVQIKGRIENLLGAEKALYILSEDGVSMIDAPNGGIVATDMIELHIRNHEPVNQMIPTVKDDVMIYLGRDKEKILVTDYDFVVQRFRAQDISHGYDDFLLNKIKELHYIPRKASFIYGMLESGEWFALLFDPTSEKNSLFPFDTDGFVMDLCPIKFNDETKLLMVVQRHGQFLIEEKFSQRDIKLVDHMTKEEQESYCANEIMGDKPYLDCSVNLSSDIGKALWDEIPYAAGSSVSGIIDGKYVSDITVKSNVFYGYAWYYNDIIVYTDSQTPQIGDSLYRLDGTVLDELSIVAVNVDGSIDIRDVHDEEKTMCGYSRIEWLTASTPSGWSPAIGTVSIVENYTPNANKHWYMAWISNGVYDYTYPAVPVVGRNIYRYNSNRGAYYTDASALVTAVGPKTSFFTTDDTVGNNVEVYNTSYQSQGYSSITLWRAQSGNPDLDYMCGQITVNGTNYFRDTDIDTTHIFHIDVTNTFVRYPERDIQNDQPYIELEEPANHVILGYEYDSYIVLKFATPYTSKKFVKEVGTFLINTAYLDIGNTFEDRRPILNNLVDTITLGQSRVLLNGEYVKTLDKQTENNPYVIVGGKFGLPFTITGLDYKVDYSNYQGGV